MRISVGVVERLARLTQDQKAPCSDFGVALVLHPDQCNHCQEVNLGFDGEFGGIPTLATKFCLGLPGLCVDTNIA